MAGNDPPAPRVPRWVERVGDDARPPNHSTLALGLALTALAAGAAGCSETPVPGPAAVTTNDGSVDVSDASFDGGIDAIVDSARDDVTDAGDTVDAAPAVCGSTQIIAPTGGTTLGVAADTDRDCTNGFTTDVTVSTNAPAGTALELRVNGRRAATNTVGGPVVTFPAVSLDTAGPQTLEVYQSGVTDACASISIGVQCNTPRCQITAPTRTVLNLTDRATPTLPFTVDMTVGTDIEDGRQVQLQLTNRTDPLRATVFGGEALFRAVELSPDGEFRARATCTNAVGNTGTSAEAVFTVDSLAPALSITRPMRATTFGLSSDLDPEAPGVQFRVCGTTDQAGQDVCASIEGGSPVCATVTDPAMEACVTLTCPTGSAPFAIDVDARDAAGNTTIGLIEGVRCQSSLPSVRIVTPEPFDLAVPTTTINVARDADRVTPGAQVNIVACTDRPGAVARLHLNGDSAPYGEAVTVEPTAVGDECASLGGGFTGIARFVRVTLPQSTPAPTVIDDLPPTNPSIEVSVTDGGDRGVSPTVPLYVDTYAPVPAVATCNRLVVPGPDGFATLDIDVSSDAYPVTLTLTREGSMPSTLTLATPPVGEELGHLLGVRFAEGSTALTLSATDPAGNSATSVARCVIDVGNPPTLAFTTPTAAQVITSSAARTITLRTDAPVGTSVTLTVGTRDPITGVVGAGGVVTFTGVTLPEGDAVVLTAETAFVDGRGVGRASVTVSVDSLAPTGPTGLAGSVPTTPRSARRAGTIRLTWTDGGDTVPGGGTRPVASYELRESTVPLSDLNFSMATRVTTTITPGAPGSTNTADVTGLSLEAPHYFAIRALDASGNPSATVAYAGPVTIPLVRDTVTDVTAVIGNDVSGGFDVNGDGFADVLVGSGLNAGVWSGLARVYFGSATGLSSTRYAQFNGTSSARFGSAVASLGDVNGDGLGDLAIGEPGPTAATSLTAGNVYVFFGRATWNGPSPPYAATEANVVLGGSTGEFARASLGFSLTRVGDFNGDGLNDIAAGAPQPNATATARGAVFVWFGRRSFPASITPESADVVIRNTSTETLFGRHVGSGGRIVGNDTREDLLVGYGAGTGTGNVAVFGGRTSSTQVSLTQTDAALLRPGVATTPANLGQIMAQGVGDLDGDGRGDLAVGTAIRGPGRVALYFGNAAGGLTEGPVVESITVTDADTFGARFGYVTDPARTQPSLLVPSPAGADLLAGAVAYMGGDPRLYVFTGRPSARWSGLTVLNASTVVSLGGAASQPLSGVAWVGDVDGDGYPDAALGRATGTGLVMILR